MRYYTFVIQAAFQYVTMINTEEFTKRLHVLMDFYELSAASFADKIDVGRSSISHLLSGRNKPSLDFVMKIVKAFPEVELYWLLNGKGNFPAEKLNQPSAPRDHKAAPKKSQEASSVKAFLSGSEKQIERIVLFYTDGSFDAFEN